MANNRQRTTFAKSQKERARMEKAAAKRARRQARRVEPDVPEQRPEAEWAAGETDTNKGNR